jgi:hypothetical protein
MRRVAAALDSTRLEFDRHRAAAGTGLAAPSGADPEWAATAALCTLAATLDEGLAQLVRRFDDTAAALRTAAGGYEAADDRAACRLRGCRGGTW